MIKRIAMVFLTMVLAVISLLIAAKYPTGPNSISYDEPVGLWLSLGMMIILFLPPFILSFFNNSIVKVISVTYQAFIALIFLGIIFTGFFVSSGGFWISMVGILGSIATICSIVVTISVGKSRIMNVNATDDIH